MSMVREREVSLFGEFTLDLDEVRALIMEHCGADRISTCDVGSGLSYAWVVVTGNNANLLTPGRLILGQGATREQAVQDLFWRVMTDVLLG